MYEKKTKTICIMGMGYVGLTLSVVLAEADFKVYGIEAKKEVADMLAAGKPHFHEKNLDIILRGQLSSKNLVVSTSLPASSCDMYVVCVGTPLAKGAKKPNMEYIKNVAKDVGKHIKPGALVCLRSTVPVGTTRNVVIPILEKESGLLAGRDFSVAFTPERTIEGNAIAELRSNSQIIGSFDEESAIRATDVFRRITHTIVNVSSLEGAELIKILDNTYRDVRFAYANEIAMICEKLHLNAPELISAANTHYPRNNIPMPSPGVGGACLSKDPHILIEFANEAGYYPHLIKSARDINEMVPERVVARVKDKLAEFGKDIKTAKVFMVGFAFKGEPETSDLRDSTSLWVLDKMKKHANNIYGYDPVVGRGEISALGIKYATIEEGSKNADAILFLNNHRSYLRIDPSEIVERMNKPCVFYDAWGMFNHPNIKWRKDVYFAGVGI